MKIIVIEQTVYRVPNKVYEKVKINLFPFLKEKFEEALDYIKNNSKAMFDLDGNYNY